MGHYGSVRKEIEITYSHPTFAKSVPTIFLAWWINSLGKQEPDVTVIVQSYSGMKWRTLKAKRNRK